MGPRVGNLPARALQAALCGACHSGPDPGDCACATSEWPDVAIEHRDGPYLARVGPEIAIRGRKGSKVGRSLCLHTRLRPLVAACAQCEDRPRGPGPGRGPSPTPSEARQGMPASTCGGRTGGSRVSDGRHPSEPQRSQFECWHIFVPQRLGREDYGQHHVPQVPCGVPLLPCVVPMHYVQHHVAPKYGGRCSCQEG